MASIRPKDVPCRKCGDKKGFHSVFEQQGNFLVQIAVCSECRRPVKMCGEPPRYVRV